MTRTHCLARAISRFVWLPVLWLPLAAQTASTDVTTWGTFETREYRAENGRRIRITSRGNLAGLETPFGFEHIENGGRAREGYVVSYDDPATGATRVLYDVNDLYSRVLGGHRDLVPYMFRGPANGVTFAHNTAVSATVVVDTLDGALRLTHLFEWRAGRGGVKVTTTVTNRLGGYVALRGFKRHADINLDGAGAYGVALTSDWARSDKGVGVWARCNCAPGPPPSPLTPELVSQHFMSFTGAPAPVATMIKRSGDLSELSSPGPVLTSDLPGTRRNENNQATLVWSGARLAPSGSQTFVAEYTVE